VAVPILATTSHGRLAEQQKGAYAGLFYDRYWARTSDPSLSSWCPGDRRLIPRSGSLLDSGRDAQAPLRTLAQLSAHSKTRCSSLPAGCFA